MKMEPLDEILIPPEIAALPKADIHIHAEWSPRLDAVLACRDGREPYDWRAWAQNLMQTEPQGEARLRQLSIPFPALRIEDAIPENFVARTAMMLEEAAADGAVLIEIRFGKDMRDRPDFFTLLHQAEDQVREQYPRLRTAAIPFIHLDWDETTVKNMVEQIIDWAREGLIYGVDVFNAPYTEEADWTNAYRVGERLAAAGLGITVHVAEFAPVNIPAVLQMPGLTRLGHATHAGYHPHLVERVAKSGVTVECALTCNVVLGAVDSYAAHPIRRFVDQGIPIALCTDDPVQVCTTIGREYAIAHRLGFSVDDLVGFTRNAINAAFISPERRAGLLRDLTLNPSPVGEGLKVQDKGGG